MALPGKQPLGALLAACFLWLPGSLLAQPAPNAPADSSADATLDAAQLDRMEQEGRAYQQRVEREYDEKALALLPPASTPRIDLQTALFQTVSRDPQIALAAQAASRAGGVELEAKGAFDTTLSASVTRSLTRTPIAIEGDNLEIQRDNLTAYQVSLSRKLRNGIILSPQITVQRSPGFLIKGLNIEDPMANYSTVTFGLTIPLLQGAGTKANTAQERAARYNREAQLFNLQHTVSEQVNQAASAYWQCAAAEALLRLAAESEMRSYRTYASVQKLVKYNQAPAAELSRADGDRREKSSERVAAQLQLYQARQALALAVGKDLQEIAAAPLASSAFPEAIELIQKALDMEQGVILEAALPRRRDFLASIKAIEGRAALLDLAKNGMLPQLDLQLQGGYAGLAQTSSYGGMFSALGRNVTAFNTYASLSLQWPIENRVARGQLTQAEADYRTAIIQSSDLARNIRSQGLDAMEGVKKQAAQVDDLATAAAAYKKALDEQKELYRMGASSLIDLINTENSFAAVESDLISARASYAVAVANLRFVTGTLIDFDGERYSLNPKVLLYPPTLEELRGVGKGKNIKQN